MVKDTGKALRADAHRAVNNPEPLKVDEDTIGKPVAVRMPRRQVIASIDDCWRIDDEWWREEPVSRLYYAVCLNSGQKLEIYHDIVNDGWYRQSY